METGKVKQTSGLGVLLVLLYSFGGVIAILGVLIFISVVLENGILELIAFFVLLAIFIAIPYAFSKSRRKAFEQKLEESGFAETERFVDKGHGILAIDQSHKRVAFMSYMNPFNIYIIDGKDIKNIGSGQIGSSTAGGIGFWFTVGDSKKLFFHTLAGRSTGASAGYAVGGLLGALIGSAIEKSSGTKAKYATHEEHAAEWAEKLVDIGGWY